MQPLHVGNKLCIFAVFRVTIILASVVMVLGLGSLLVFLTPTLGKAARVRRTRQKKPHGLQYIDAVYIRQEGTISVSFISAGEV